jgi:ABC-type branched-subunit amino acid transport system substrate-binding protein
MKASLFLVYFAICTNVADCNILSHYKPKAHFNIAAQSPIKLDDGTPDYEGIAVEAAILLAIKEINNKTDGFMDDILPESELRLVMRSTTYSFQEGVEVALEQFEAFGDDEEPVGCVGPMSYSGMRGSAPIFEDKHIAQIGYNARESALGYSDIYPNVLRTVPGYYVDGLVLADLVHDYFNYNRVALFSTSDTYGK